MQNYSIKFRVEVIYALNLVFLNKTLQTTLHCEKYAILDVEFLPFLDLQIYANCILIAESDWPTSRLFVICTNSGGRTLRSNRSRAYGRPIRGGQRGDIRATEAGGWRNVENERENYVSWWRERTPGRLSWAHASLVLLGSPQREDLSLSRSTSVASVDTRETPVMLLVIESCPRDRRRRLESWKNLLEEVAS